MRCALCQRGEHQAAARYIPPVKLPCEDTTFLAIKAKVQAGVANNI